AVEKAGSAAGNAMASEASTHKTWSPALARSVRRWQPAHDELDLAVGQHPPRFDLGHIGRLGIKLEPFFRLLPRLGARQAKSLPPPARRHRGPTFASAGDALGHIGRLLAPHRHRGLSRLERLARFWPYGESGIGRPSAFPSADERPRQASVDESEARGNQREAEELARHQPLVQEECAK